MDDLFDIIKTIAVMIILIDIVVNIVIANIVFWQWLGVTL